MPTRIVSVDALRGLTVAAMILVNDPGDPHAVYPQLRHADWNGYTAADIVFPNFLFLSGVSLVFSLEGKVQRAGARRLELARGLGRRSANLILLKLALAVFPTFRLRRLRIFGVLFRTAFCSLAGGLILLVRLDRQRLLGLAGALVAAYTVALRVPFQLADGSVLNIPLLDPDNNLAARVDRGVARLLHGHLHAGALYNVTHDPEGLLSSVSAVATVLLGAWAGSLLRDPALPPTRRIMLLTGFGLLLLGVGTLWNRRLPINKNLWTGSYVAVAGGWSMLALAAGYAVLDLPGGSRSLEARLRHRLSLPSRVLGANALAIYVLSVAGHKLLRTLHVLHDGHSVSVRTLAYRLTFGRSRSTPARSLAFAVTYAGLCFVPALALWRRRIFVKI